MKIDALFKFLWAETEPVMFPQVNGTLCGNNSTKDLPVCRTLENLTISCWRVPIWKRLRLLFSGRVWLVVKGSTQPPLWIDTEVFWK